jgi:hypothetical protein
MKSKNMTQYQIDSLIGSSFGVDIVENLNEINIESHKQKNRLDKIYEEKEEGSPETLKN